METMEMAVNIFDQMYCVHQSSLQVQENICGQIHE